MIYVAALVTIISVALKTILAMVLGATPWTPGLFTGALRISDLY